MSQQSNLNDIWRSVGREISFYTKETFQDIPDVPGVYAWFYPLRITTDIFDEFLNEINTVLNYDPETKGEPKRVYSADLNWQQIVQSISIKTKSYNIDKYRKTWDKIMQDDNSSTTKDNFKRIIMRASIFLSPLYVGKAKKLKTRCFQHINGKGQNNDFNNRFETYALEKNLTSKKIKDLIFVTLLTENNPNETEEAEKLVEAILKNLAKPKYSIL
jgi:hypothetical protein